MPNPYSTDDDAPGKHRGKRKVETIRTNAFLRDMFKTGAVDVWRFPDDSMKANKEFDGYVQYAGLWMPFEAKLLKGHTVYVRTWRNMQPHQYDVLADILRRGQNVKPFFLQHHVIGYNKYEYRALPIEVVGAYDKIEIERFYLIQTVDDLRSM